MLPFVVAATAAAAGVALQIFIVFLKNTTTTNPNKIRKKIVFLTDFPTFCFLWLAF